MNNHIRHYALWNTALEYNFDVGISREEVSVWMGLCGIGAVIGLIFRMQFKWKCLSKYFE